MCAMIYSIKNVIAAAKNRKPGYLEAVMKMAKPDGEHIELTDEQVESLKKYHFSRGLGDTIAKITSAVSREGIVVQLRLDQFATRTLSVPILRKLTGSELSVCAVLSGIRDSELSFINPCRNRFPVMLWRGVRDESAPLTYRIDPVWQQSGALNTDLLEVVLPDSIEPPAQ